ncbi:hypothetical protein B0H13DRAFT_2322340 [Mycena leptocephala]|nr:hypothetical protein B0H13DRAFT_2322340 [Mycena leptocephala]
MTTILQFPDASLSILASNLPDTSRTKFMIVVLVVSVIVLALIYYFSPMRLTRVLVAAITGVQKTYLEALETALLSPSDIDTAEILQLKVSKIREASLRNSLSHSVTLREFFTGHTFTLHCIHEVQVLETHIEVFSSSLYGPANWHLLSKILKESQLREDNLHPFANRVRMVCLHRRRHSPSSNA